MSLNSLNKDELIEVFLSYAVFTENMRKVANEALAHANHILSNYAKDVPDDKLSDWAKAQVAASGILTCPAPMTATVIQ